MWVVCDGSHGCFDDEATPLVVVADTEDRAVELWYDATGLEGVTTPETRPGEWNAYVYGPEPVHAAEGVWNGEIRGYGLWWDSDPECEECNEHQHPIDVVVLYWPEYGRSGELAVITCRWCAVDQAEVCSG